MSDNGVCQEMFYAWDSSWSVPRFCHRPADHRGEHCASSGRAGEHIHNCTDAVDGNA
jgi:hypothetical protein